MGRSFTPGRRGAAARAAALACALAGCVVGAPPGFSKGERWVFPLVGPLEDGVLVTPVSINGHGPYLFAIDPDANITAIDRQVVEESELRVGSGPHRIDETDTGQVRRYAEMIDLRIGDLVIDRRDAMVFPIGLYDSEGRHLNGILGRDVIADSLVFGFDRDHGIATLSTVSAFRAPPDAIAVKYQAVSSRSSSVTTVGVARLTGAGPLLPDIPPVPRRLATAQIGRARFSMHLDLGAVHSQLGEPAWAAAGLRAAQVTGLRVVDEAATERTVDRIGVGDAAIGPVGAAGVVFVPYIDRRFSTEGVDGALGLDFFRGFAVYAHWDASTYFVRRRTRGVPVAARLGRWGADLPTCAHPGCAAAALVGDAAAPIVQITRDPQAVRHALELLIEAEPAQGGALPPLVAALPSTVDAVDAPLPAAYAGATLRVIDASPFPRACAGDGGCVWPLHAPGPTGGRHPGDTR